MLAGANPRDIATLGCQMRSAWLNFIRTGTPGTAWPQFTPNAPTVHHLGAACLVKIDYGPPTQNGANDLYTYAPARRTIG
jgi:hypothetical protein